MDCDSRSEERVESLSEVGVLPSIRDGLRRPAILPADSTITVGVLPSIRDGLRLPHHLTVLKPMDSRSTPFNKRWIATLVLKKKSHERRQSEYSLQ